MIKLKEGDVIAFKRGDRYYYAVVITPIIMFGGNLVYAFHMTTDDLISLAELLKRQTSGFNAVVDFILAKREKRIIKLGSIKNPQQFRKTQYFKRQTPNKKFWFIEELKDKTTYEIKRTEKLNEEEVHYPYLSTIPTDWLADYIDKKWSPEQSDYVNL